LAFKQVIVVIAFALCGWFSSGFWDNEHATVSLALPVPFSLLCALLFVRSIRAVLIVPAINLAWWFAYFMAFLGSLTVAGLPTWVDYLPVVSERCVAGETARGCFHGSVGAWPSVYCNKT
jgi:hypothetical protein